MVTYRWIISGYDGEGYSWKTKGEIEASDFQTALTNARRDSFLLLTQGKAEYGHPGLGCSGPYRITNLALILNEETKDDS